VGLVKGVISYETPNSWMTSPALFLFQDDSWDNYHKAPSCDEKVKFAHTAIAIGSITRAHQELMRHRIGAPKRSKTEKNESTIKHTFEWEIIQEERDVGWFLIAADCALEQYNTKVPPMSYDIVLMNAGEDGIESASHLDATEDYITPVLCVTLLLMALYALYCMKLVKENHGGNVMKTHLVVRLFAGAYVAQQGSVMFELVHLVLYRYDGDGSFFFDFGSEILEGLSSMLISFILICLASGWTLVDTEADNKSKNSLMSILKDPRQLTKGANPGVVVMVILMIVTVYLQAMNKGHDESFHKFHDWESTPGYMLLALRLVLGSAFVISLAVTIRGQQKLSSMGENNSLLSFLYQILICGSIYFMALPLLVLAASFLEHYRRHRFVTVGMIIIQNVCLLALSLQFLSGSSTYSKLTMLSDSGMLPMAGGLVKPVKSAAD
jgi:hypothetical protein